MLFVGLSVGPAVKAQEVPFPQRAFTFRYENDFFNATDKYYTQGVVLDYSAPFIGRSPTTRALLRLRDAGVQHALFAEQNCFTPSSIRRDTIFTGDRPFAAALFVGQRALSIDPTRGLKLTSALMASWWGRPAEWAEEQRGIHRALDNIEPLGWQFQVASALILNYAARIEKRLLRLPFAEASLGASADLGTYRSNAGVNGRLELGRFRSDFDVRGPGPKAFRASAFVDGQVKAIAYDASMQGGLFNADSPYVLQPEAIERLVLSGGGGVKLAYGKLSLTYAKTFITREFVGGTDHGWGTCTIKVLF